MSISPWSDISPQDRQDMVIGVFHAFWKMLERGKFKGKHGEASIKACISSIAHNKKVDFLEKFIKEKKLRVYAPEEKEDKPSGGVYPTHTPWIENYPPYWGEETDEDVVTIYERKERIEFIKRETKYPEIIDSHRKGYSIKVIARTYGLNDEQVKKRIQREIKRLAKIAKQQGWRY